MKTMDLREAIQDIPVIDIHSHLKPEHLAARSLDQVLCYHMVQYPMRAYVDAREITPDNQEASASLFADHEGLMASLQTQSFGRMLRRILRDLYDQHERLTPQNLDMLRQVFAERTSQPGWGQAVLERAGIEYAMCGSNRKEPPQMHLPHLSESFGWGLEVQPSAGFHVNRTWQERTQRLGQMLGGDILCVGDLDAAVAAFFHAFAWPDGFVYIAWVSAQAHLHPIPGAQVDRLLTKAHQGEALSIQESWVLEGALLRAICQAICGRARIFQLVYGTQVCGRDGVRHPSVSVNAEFASGLAWLAHAFPDIHFNILSGAEADEPVLCSLCLGYSNVSLGGFWWASFYPSVMHAAWHRRLDMVPLARLCGFFSDGYCADWVYARMQTTRDVLALVLAERIERGWCDAEQAMHIARTVLYDTPKGLFAEQG